MEATKAVGAMVQLLPDDDMMSEAQEATYVLDSCSKVFLLFCNHQP